MLAAPFEALESLVLLEAAELLSESELVVLLSESVLLVLEPVLAQHTLPSVALVLELALESSLCSSCRG